MDRKHNITLTVLGVLALFVSLLGATFAFFSATSKSKPQVITTSNLSLSVVLKGSQHVTNLSPTTWSSTMSKNDSNENIAKIPFEVTTKEGVKAIYDIILSTTISQNTSLSGGTPEDIKYKLFKVGETSVLKEGNLSANFNKEIVTDAQIAQGSALNDQYILYIYIENKEEAQNTLQNIEFNIRLTGTADQVE